MVVHAFRTVTVVGGAFFRVAQDAVRFVDFLELFSALGALLTSGWYCLARERNAF
jgi:hypothetical protein